MNALSDSVAATFSSRITRRSLLQRAMRVGLVAGAALASPLVLFNGIAAAANCSANDTVGTWGCTCNSGTPGCGGNCTSGKCSNSARKRCDYWTIPNPNDGQYCWCSLGTASQCCSGGIYGHYTCCDCWLGGSGACDHQGTGTKCACKQFHQVGTC